MILIKNENYIVIQGWMVNELGLKGNELLIYAIIYGFSQDENQSYTGGLQYLCNWLNSTKQTVINTLKSLQDKNLIEKSENIMNGVKFCEYRSKNFTGGQNFLMGWSKNLNGGGQNFLPNNKSNINNYINNKKENIKRKSFAPPTLQEVKSYCEEAKINIDCQRFIDYYQSNGWKVGKNPMKDWKATVRNWSRREEKEKGKLPDWYNNQDLVQEEVSVDDEELKKLQEKLGG